MTEWASLVHRVRAREEFLNLDPTAKPREKRQTGLSTCIKHVSNNVFNTVFAHQLGDVSLQNHDQSSPNAGWSAKERKLHW